MGVDNYLCQNTTGIELDRCEEDSGPSLQNYLALFIIARILHGVGAEPLYTWAVTYLDDIVTKETFSFYVGENFTVL